MAVSMALPGVANARAAENRTLTFHNMHTGERLTAAYLENGRYVREALRAIDRICRDFRSGDVYRIDPQLLNLAHELSAQVAPGKPLQLISAYRSPRTNANLASKSGGVAKRSLHMQGKALDIRIEGVDTRHLYKAARHLERGGAGLYTRSGFVHVDIGRVRYWGN